MREYTLLAVTSVFITIIIGSLIKTKVFMRREFYIYLLAIIFFKLLVNGFLTGQNIVIYNPGFFLGLRIGSIPLEDFFFGFSMITQTIIFWEHFKEERR